MIIRPASESRSGSVLVVALVTALLIGITLGSYLWMVRAQHAQVLRSQSWNAALAMAEAGVEEAMAQLNPGAETNRNRTANGWGSPAAGFYGPVAREFGSASYQVKFTDEEFPTIYATGRVHVPLINQTVTRAIKVSTTNAPLFTGVLCAEDGILMNGNNVNSDSFNSADPNLSNNGSYDPTRTSTNGDIASIYGIVDVGNANINGDVLLGPEATLRSIGPNGVVTGGVAYDFNFAFPEVLLPDGSWLTQIPNPRTIDGQSYEYVFENSGNWIISGAPRTIYVGTNAHVNLMFTGDVSPDLIRVAGRGNEAGNLAIYMAGEKFALAGNALVDGGVPANLAYFGLPSNTQISISGGADFIGTIYAPSASLTLNGSGLRPVDVSGAVVVRTATLNGHFGFHFDEALLLGKWRGYVAVLWQEI